MTGLPVTVKMPGRPNPTLVTVPPPLLAPMVMVPLPLVIVTPGPAESALSESPPLPLAMRSSPALAPVTSRPVPPLAGAKIPPKTTAPVAGLTGVNPVEPALNDATPAVTFPDEMKRLPRMSTLPLMVSVSLGPTVIKSVTRLSTVMVSAMT